MATLRSVVEALPLGRAKEKPQEPSGEMAFLRGVSIFKGLSDEQIRKVRERMSTKIFEAGTPIIREGEIDADNVMYILEEGTVEISKTVTLKVSSTDFGQKEKSFIRLTGAMRPFFGEMSMLEENTERSATVAALDRCATLVITKKDFEALAAEDPVIGYVVVTNIARVLADRLRKTNNDVLKLTTALSLALSH